MLILLGFDKAPMLLLLTTSECFHWLHYLQCQYPLYQSNNTINHPEHILIRISLVKHQLNNRCTNELREKYSENSSLKKLKPMLYSYRVQSMNLHRKSMSGFYFKVTLTWNELSITNHEIHGFSNSFQHIKN